MTTAQIKKSWNAKARELGCKARIGGNKKKIEFQIWLRDENGFEIVVKITSVQFSKLVNPFPELH